MKTSKKNAFTYLDGWRCAAACEFIPKDMEQNEHFLAGWRNGREARRKAKVNAEEKYGIVFDIVRAMQSDSTPG